MLRAKNVVVGLSLVYASAAFAQKPAPATTQPAPAAAPQAPAPQAPAAVPQMPAAAPQAPAVKQATPPATPAVPQQAPTVPPQPRTLESQPGKAPTSAPGDTYEQNPDELKQTACELHQMIKRTEAKASPNEAAGARASREALIVSQKRELKGALSVYKKVTGQTLNLETACQ